MTEQREARAPTRSRPRYDLAALRSRREEILAAAARHGATNVRVFGSVARGDADHESDVDIAVTMPPDSSLLAVGGLYAELEELLSCAFDLLVDWPGLRPELRAALDRDAVPL